MRFLKTFFHSTERYRKMNAIRIITICAMATGMLCARSVTIHAQQQGTTMSSISKTAADNSIQKLINANGEKNRFRIERGVRQTASLWTRDDGSEQEFESFCAKHFIVDEQKLKTLFEKISENFESILGHYNKISLDLKRALHLDLGPIEPVDEIFGGFDPYAHFTDDFYRNKIAFIITLNFPFYNLKEKNELGPKWTRLEWAYARMGDLFTSRVPARLNQEFSEVTTTADTYIAQYNIYMGQLLDAKGKTLFPAELRLISHWGLRDELKSRYADKNGLAKQRMIYEVMKRIISQEIPEPVINNKTHQWNPATNKMFLDGKETAFRSEPNTRFQHWLNIYRVCRKIDPYTPAYPNMILRQFDQNTELSYEEVEKLFTGLMSSETVRKTGALISKRLKRKLEPFDIWYDGFKARSTISEDELSQKTRTLYPTHKHFEKDMPNILVKLGFGEQRAKTIASMIVVDASRGAGHAWGAQMKSEKAHLRSRSGKDGMDYKGYNIAMHEFGHNVEQTITLQDVDYYMLNGVPTTAFTEAIAFNFQKRDLDVLGIKNEIPNQKELESLDKLWSSYEIMGVALLDMRVWKWLYANPDADAEQLKNQVSKTAKEIWNEFYAPVFGVKDQTILAIYSHMIDNPIYLPAYPLGHLIEFQINQYFEGKNMAVEMDRMLKQGRILPQVWMKGAVGKEISIEPMLKAGEEALRVMK